VASFVLGCALILRQEATLRFMTRMNRWVSTRETFARLDRRIDLDRGAVPGARRPIFGTIFLVAGLAGIGLVLWRLQFLPYSMARRADAVSAWFFGTVAVDTLKWVLVVGFAFTAFVGFLMLVAPARLVELETRLNQWHSTEDSIAATSDKVHMPLEPLVSAYPRASGWIIAIASLLMVLGMLGLAAKLH
jgi:hypothetical protein